MAITTNIQDGFGGVANHSTGLIVTDAGAAAAATIVCGFAPRLVRFHNVTDRISDEWIEGMAAASSIHTIAAGTRTLETTNGITVVPNGFTVTAATLLASKSFSWEAIC
jgi:phosphatidylserine synthase